MVRYKDKKSLVRCKDVIRVTIFRCFDVYSRFSIISALQSSGKEQQSMP